MGPKFLRAGIFGSRISDRPELEDICIGSNLHSRGKCNKEEKEDDDGLEPGFFL